MPHSRDPDIICFKHCGKNIFIFSVPIRCPICRQTLEKCKEILPFALPYPFINATQAPCSVILRPSSGDFLSDFQNSTNLHIALTDSCGSVIEFDRPGLLRTAAKHVDKMVWRQCLVIAQVPESWYNEWECTLRHVIEQQGWREKKYDDEKVNCYSFVLDFLRFLKYDDYSLFVDDRRVFSTKFVVPKTAHAAKYITIFRRIKEHNYWMEKD